MNLLGRAYFVSVDLRDANGRLIFLGNLAVLLLFMSQLA